MLPSENSLFYHTNLPLLLVERLKELLISPIRAKQLTIKQYQFSLLFFDRLLTNQERHIGSIKAYYEIPSTYLKKLNMHYERTLAKLKKADILDVFRNDVTGTESFSVELSSCKAYRVNQRLFAEGSTTVIIPIEQAEASPAHYTAPEPFNDWIVSDLTKLSFDHERAECWLEEYLSNLSLTRWQVNTASPEYRTNAWLDKVRLNLDSPRAKAFNAQKLLDEELPKHVGKQVFRLNKGHVLATPDEFKQHKRLTMRYSYSRAIQKLKNREFWTSQSQTNNRLHYNLTELPKKLLDFVTFDGKPLVEVDGANCQVALLAHVMQHGDVLGLGVDFPPLPDTPQTSNFLEDAQTGVVYDKLATIVSDGDREVAKLEVMLWLFSKSGFNLPASSPLAQRYGEVVKWMKQAKKILEKIGAEINDSKLGLAVYLQRLEAELMIHQIYPNAKARGFTLFSKHDSFLVPTSDAQAVQELMQEVFTSQNIVMNIRCKEAPVSSDHVTLQ
jgi:hypothetical protein